MWIKTQNNVLVNTDHVESIYIKGSSIICAGHKYDKDVKNERVIGEFDSRFDADLVLRLIWEAIKSNEASFYLPTNLGHDA